MIPTIFFIGEVSSGKSSLINALACKFVTSVSLQRETFIPTRFRFRKLIVETNIDLKLEHENNVNQRQNNNDMQKDQQINNVNVKLYDLSEINIIDFPGLNDGQDSQDKYLKYVTDNIKEANMICFITDANTAFVKKSELDTFNKIKKMTEDEWKNNKHYISLCIIVNKYDNDPDYNDDEDLADIYNRIPRDNFSLHRISSHKLLCHRLLQDNISLQIPDFLQNETQKIMKNAELCNIKKIHSPLTFNKAWFKRKNLTKKGDWDDLLLSFGSIMQTNNLCAGKLLSKNYEILIDDIEKSFVKYNYINNQLIFIYQKSESDRYHHKNDLEHKDNIYKLKNNLKEFFAKACEYQMDSSILNRIFMGSQAKIVTENLKKQNRLIFLEYVFIILKRYGMTDAIISMLTQYYDSIAIETTLNIVNHVMTNFDKIKNQQIQSLIFMLLRNNTVYKSISSIPFFDNDSLVCVSIPKYDNSAITHSSWFIHNLLNSNVTEDCIKYMVLLSTKSYIVIGQMIHDGILNQNVFEKFKYYIGDDFMKRLEIECKYVKDQNICIESMLFSRFSSHDKYEEYKSFDIDFRKISQKQIIRGI